VYALDLCGVNYYTLCGVWIGWGILSGVCAYVSIMGWEGYVVDLKGESKGLDHLMSVMVLGLQVAVSILLLFCLVSAEICSQYKNELSKPHHNCIDVNKQATWTTLQFKWLPNQTPTLTSLLERTLHTALPPISAAMIAHGLTSTMTYSYVTWGIDSLATLFPYLFAFHLACGIWLVGAAPSMLGGQEEDNSYKSKDGKKEGRDKSFVCAIYPREGRLLSNLLVFAPMMVHLMTFRQRIVYSYASWDDLWDFILASTVPYLLHYLLASNGVFDERWRRSLNWLLKAGTSPLEGGRTVRGAAVPMVISLLACISFQQRYLISLCAWASYILNGHEGVISSTLATIFLTLGTLFMYATVWFFGRQHADGSYLLGDYHEDVFQMLLGASAIFFGMSCSPPWTFLPVPMLFAESLALWIISKQVRLLKCHIVKSLFQYSDQFFSLSS
jgi:hypothetical protein